MVTDSEGCWENGVVYCEDPNPAGPDCTRSPSDDPGTHMGSRFQRPFLWIQAQQKHIRCNIIHWESLEGQWEQLPMGDRGRHKKLLGSCILMPPSSTHDTREADPRGGSLMCSSRAAQHEVWLFIWHEILITTIASIVYSFISMNVNG